MLPCEATFGHVTHSYLASEMHLSMAYGSSVALCVAWLESCSLRCRRLCGSCWMTLSITEARSPRPLETSHTLW